MKRIALFVLTNLAVVVVLGIVASLLGVNRYLTANGLNLGALLGFALIMGFGGAIISLLISKPVAKWSAGVQIIEQPRNADEAWIVDTVRKFADKAGIGMPEVGIFEGAPNAFATGAFKNSALVAVSTGLLQGHDARGGRGRDRPRGGPHRQRRHGHDDADPGRDEHLCRVHLSRVIGYAVDSFLRNDNDGPGIGYMSRPSCWTSCWACWPPSSWPGSAASASSAPTPAPRS
jgi:heat shock protein HtpX